MSVSKAHIVPVLHRFQSISSTFHPNWQNLFPFIVLSLLAILSVIWAVNIWTELPEYPLDFPFFPTLLEEVQGIESKVHTSICSRMVHRKND